MQENAILFITHKIDKIIIDRYLILKDSAKEFGDFFLVLNSDNSNQDVAEVLNPYFFDSKSLNDLGYNPIDEAIIPGSNHFILLKFFKDFPKYNYYWNIEYDVYYSGNWKSFFCNFSNVNADLLSSHIERFSNYPDWAWWNSLILEKIVISPENLIKSFNPIYRISNRALFLLDNLLKSPNNKGHHEVFIPTILYHFNMSLVDFGGKGEFVLPGYEEKFYLSNGKNSGSICYRPNYYENEIVLENKLFHPVKAIAPPKVLAIVVAYNWDEHIISCLNALAQSTYKVELVLINNKALDDCAVEVLKAFFSDIIIENSQSAKLDQLFNIGFQYAINKTCDYILWLNQNVKVDKFMIRELIDCYILNSDYEILSPLLLEDCGIESENLLNSKLSFTKLVIGDLLLNKKPPLIYPCSFINKDVWILPMKSIQNTINMTSFIFNFKDKFSNEYVDFLLEKRIGLATYARAWTQKYE